MGGRAVRRIAEFMDVPLMDEDLALVVEKSSFAHMQCTTYVQP